MTITLEQFNKIALKDDLEELKKIVDEIGKKIDTVLTLVDSIAKKHKTFEQELISNIAAHDRFQTEIDTIKQHVKIEA